MPWPSAYECVGRVITDDPPRLQACVAAMNDAGLRVAASQFHAINDLMAYRDPVPHPTTQRHQVSPVRCTLHPDWPASSAHVLGALPPAHVLGASRPLLVCPRSEFGGHPLG